MSSYVFTHLSTESSLQLSRRAAERHTQLESVRRSRELHLPDRSPTLWSRLVHVFA